MDESSELACSQASRLAAVYSRHSFNLDSSAILFGRGSTGGAINQVSKAPTLAPLESLTAIFGSNDLYRATADINEPLSDNAAVRMNAMAEASEVAERENLRNRRWGLAPSITIGIGGASSVTLAYLHQQENNVPDAGIVRQRITSFQAPAGAPDCRFE
jgi:catecholate siderophore receptor